jgi:cytochrome d ubiquinol oxidase subunit II
MEWSSLWFVLLWLMLAIYVALDGFDLGVGILHLFVARNEAERRQLLRSIGPVWDGNEVWLLAAGGTMFFAFPGLYSAALSGFYLPLMVVLWLLMMRALGIELRHHVNDPLWRQFWDAAFCVSSLLLTIVFGAALANVVRGVPFGPDGRFFEPLWTDFRVGRETGILDWYTLSVGITAGLALAHHGALWLIDRTDEAVQRRATQSANNLWIATGIATIAISIATLAVQPITGENIRFRGATAMPVMLAGVALIMSALFRRRHRPRSALLCSALFLIGMVSGAAAGVYPFALPGRTADAGLTIADAASADAGLQIALMWWVPGMLIAIGYFWYLYSHLPATFSIHDASEH